MRVALLVLALCGLSAGRAASRVAVNVYYESLCPYCQQFISGSFSNAWSKVPEIMDVTFVPWGNERAHQTTDGWTFECQHGEEECRLNVVHACALELAASQSAGVEFVVCMESGDEDTEACAGASGLQPDAISQCVADPATVDEMLRLRDMTDAVRPAIRGVPTVTVNGSQDPQAVIINDLLYVVCAEYDGTKPAGCA